tara:strand:+ start:122 stop:247 length:126 start_codon:yes stop_codon:yes gene_type:complete
MLKKYLIILFLGLSLISIAGCTGGGSSSSSIGGMKVPSGLK